jgi:hypothetical protein
MNTKTKIFALLLVLVAVAAPVFGQTATVQTTLSSAITSTQQTAVVVASATGIVASTNTAPTFIYVAGANGGAGELMRVDAVSSTTLTVRRAQGGVPSLFPSSARVYYGPSGGRYDPVSGNALGSGLMTNGPIRGRTCASGGNQFLPVVETGTGRVSDCISSIWVDVIPGLTPLVFEGATGNSSETTFAIAEPTSDRTVTFPDGGGTVMLSSLSTNAPDAANSVTGASAALVFEGATADAFELSLTAADPTTPDKTVTLPDATGTVMLSTLSTNAPDVANSVTGASAGLVFEGTADAFETTLTVTDPTVDRTITFPNASITVPGTIVTSCGTSATCATPSTISSDSKVVIGTSGALDGASPAVAAITGISPAFTSSSTYRCTGTVNGSGAVTTILAVSYVSGSAFTFTGTNGATGTISYVCVGN